jgi:hypothetical protein
LIRLLRDNTLLESLSVSYTNVNDAPIQLYETTSFVFLLYAKSLKSLSVSMQAPEGVQRVLRFVSQHRSLTHFSLTIEIDDELVDFVALYQDIVEAVDENKSIKTLDLRWGWNELSESSPSEIVELIVIESRMLYGRNLTVNGFAIERFEELLVIEDGFMLRHPLMIGQRSLNYLPSQE